MNMFSGLCILVADAAQPAPAGAAPGGGAFIVQMMPMILIFVIMYLLLIRPQQQKAKQHREMVSKLKVGDRIVTSGGIHGTVSGVKEQTVMLKIADKVEVEVVRSAIGTVLSGSSEGN